MGEVVLSSEDREARVESWTAKEEEEEMEKSVTEIGMEKRKKNKKRTSGSSSGVVRWERFLPRMMLRVLLVEADDSTRQIIAALLRKCSYRGQYLPLLLFICVNCWFSWIFQLCLWNPELGFGFCLEILSVSLWIIYKLNYLGVQVCGD